MTVLVVYPDAGTGNTTVDGNVSNNTAGSSWASLIGAATGTAVNDTSAATNFVVINADTTSNQWDGLTRGIFTFDSSAIAGGTVTDAIFSVVGNFKTEGFSPSIAADMNIYSASPASDNQLVVGDFSTLGSTALSTAITYASFDVSGSVYSDFVLNASGIAEVNNTGITRLGTRNANYDASAISPTWKTGFMIMQGKAADTAGTTNDPKLTITYTEPLATGEFFLMF